MSTRGGAGLWLIKVHVEILCIYLSLSYIPFSITSILTFGLSLLLPVQIIPALLREYLAFDLVDEFDRHCLLFQFFTHSFTQLNPLSPSQPKELEDLRQ